jgi:hypothetical protein
MAIHFIQYLKIMLVQRWFFFKGNGSNATKFENMDLKTFSFIIITLGATS